MTTGLTITKTFSDDALLDLRLEAANTTCTFKTNVFCGWDHLDNLIKALKSFATEINNNQYDFKLGDFGKFSAGGACAANIKHFGLSGLITITISLESSWEPAGSELRASAATIYFKVDPSSLDSFVNELTALKLNNREYQASLVGRTDY